MEMAALPRQSNFGFPGLGQLEEHLASLRTTGPTVDQVRWRPDSQEFSENLSFVQGKLTVVFHLTVTLAQAIAHQ